MFIIAAGALLLFILLREFYYQGFFHLKCEVEEIHKALSSVTKYIYLHKLLGISNQLKESNEMSHFHFLLINRT